MYSLHIKSFDMFINPVYCHPLLGSIFNIMFLPLKVWMSWYKDNATLSLGSRVCLNHDDKLRESMTLISKAKDQNHPSWTNQQTSVVRRQLLQSLTHSWKAHNCFY